jgi:hypothetical protein
VAGPFAVALASGSLATIGGTLLGPGTPAGQVFLIAGNAGLFLAPVGASAGAWYAGDPERARWIAIGGVGIAGLSLATTPLWGASSEGVGGLFTDVVLGELYSYWAAWDAFSVASRRSASPDPSRP